MIPAAPPASPAPCPPISPQPPSLPLNEWGCQIFWPRYAAALLASHELYGLIGAAATETELQLAHDRAFSQPCGEYATQLECNAALFQQGYSGFWSSSTFLPDDGKVVGSVDFGHYKCAAPARLGVCNRAA